MKCEVSGYKIQVVTCCQPEANWTYGHLYLTVKVYFYAFYGIFVGHWDYFRGHIWWQSKEYATGDWGQAEYEGDKALIQPEIEVNELFFFFFFFFLRVKGLTAVREIAILCIQIIFDWQGTGFPAVAVSWIDLLTVSAHRTKHALCPSPIPEVHLYTIGFCL